MMWLLFEMSAFNLSPQLAFSKASWLVGCGLYNSSFKLTLKINMSLNNRVSLVILFRQSFYEFTVIKQKSISTLCGINCNLHSWNGQMIKYVKWLQILSMAAIFCIKTEKVNSNLCLNSHANTLLQITLFLQMLPFQADLTSDSLTTVKSQQTISNLIPKLNNLKYLELSIWLIWLTWLVVHSYDSLPK